MHRTSGSIHTSQNSDSACFVSSCGVAQNNLWTLTLASETGLVWAGCEEAQGGSSLRFAGEFVATHRPLLLGFAAAVGSSVHTHIAPTGGEREREGQGPSLRWDSQHKPLRFCVVPHVLGRPHCDHVVCHYYCHTPLGCFCCCWCWDRLCLSRAEGRTLPRIHAPGKAPRSLARTHIWCCRPPLGISLS